MEDQNGEIKAEEIKNKDKKTVDPLPHCTTAASAEHARAHDDDEPCDDDRAGHVPEK